MSALSITTREHHDDHVLALEGEIDMATEGQFRRAILDSAASHPYGRIVLDCANLSFIDSSGLRALIQAHRGAKEHYGSLCVAAPTQRVHQVLRVTAVDTRIPVFPSVDAALTAPSEARSAR